MKSLPVRFIPLLHAFFIAVCMATVHADDQLPEKKQPDVSNAADVARPLTRTFVVSELHDLRLNVGAATITFTSGDSNFVFPAPTVQSDISKCMAVWTELRHVKSFDATKLYNLANRGKTYGIGELSIPFSEGK